MRNSFESEIGLSLRNQFKDGFVWRIISCRSYLKKPFDYILFVGGKFFAIECKSCVDKLRYENIFSHQLDNLMNVTVNDGVSLFFIRFENPNVTKNKFQCFCLSLKPMIRLMNLTKHKFATLEDFTNIAPELKRKRYGKKYGWDICSQIRGITRFLDGDCDD